MLQVGDSVQAAVESSAFSLIAIATGFAILRYHLYDIDRLISRTLSYAVVTGALVGMYVVLVTLITKAFEPLIADRGRCGDARHRRCLQPAATAHAAHRRPEVQSHPLPRGSADRGVPGVSHRGPFLRRRQCAPDRRRPAKPAAGNGRTLVEAPCPGARPALDRQSSPSSSNWSSATRRFSTPSLGCQPACTRSTVIALRARITSADSRRTSVCESPRASAARNAATARCQS